MSDLVLLTGINGYIAKHVALALLRNGYRVRGTMRNASGADALRQTLKKHGADVSRLSFVEADLTSDNHWTEAVQECAFVQHVASPFPIEQPRDREALVPAARQGTLRVLKAARAAEVKRMVITSSMVAMMYRANRPSQIAIREQDWTDPEWPRLTAYIVSKTRAEKAAWEWAEEQGWKEKLATVNPGFVLGPGLDGRMGTSLNVIELLMTGAYPAVPPIAFPIVDVRDLAEIHVKAMTSEDARGRRLIGASKETLTMRDLAVVLREAYPDRAKKIPTATLPGFFVKLLSIFDRTMSTIIPDLGVVPTAESDYVSEMTGVAFRPAKESVVASAQSLIDYGVL